MLFYLFQYIRIDFWRSIFGREITGMKFLQLISKTLDKFKTIKNISKNKVIKPLLKLIAKPFMSDLVEYMIDDKASYVGNISNIMEKNTSKKWSSQIPLELIHIKLKLKKHAYITRIQAKGYQTQILQIVFKDIDGQYLESIKMDFLPNKDVTFVKNIQHKQMVANIDLILKSIDKQNPQIMGLNYVIFRGQQNPFKPSKQKITNLTKQQNIDKVKLQKFDAPIRSKPVQSSRPYVHLTKPTGINFHQRQKRILTQKQKQSKPSNKYQDEIQRAIKESQKTFHQEMKMKKLNDEKIAQNYADNFKQDSETMPLAPQRKYKVAPLSEMIDCLKHVNSRWLEAQRNAQIQLGVKEQQRLSNYIQIKYLLNREIFIDPESIKGQRKAKLQSIAESLGAKIIKAPKNYCFIISTSWDNNIIQKSVSSLQGVKAVNQDYLIDCKKQNAELDWKNYSLKK